MRRESKRDRVYHGGSVNANRGRGCSIGTAAQVRTSRYRTRSDNVNTGMYRALSP